MKNDYFLAGNNSFCAITKGGDIQFAASVRPMGQFINALENARVIVADPGLLDSILRDIGPNERPKTVSIRECGGANLRVHRFVSATGTQYLDGAGLFPSPLVECLDLPDDAEARAIAWTGEYAAQIERVRAYIAGAGSRGVPDVRETIAGTALGAALPPAWRKGATFFANHKLGVYRNIRRADFGGRIQTFTSHGQVHENATYYDLKSAYGWAMLQPLPDWQCYDTRPRYSREPGWLDCEVEILPCPVGPLPVRQQDDSLAYPTSGIWRGTYTAEDLERSQHVKIRRVFFAYHGRYRTDLAMPVSTWLDRREQARDEITRATGRALAVSLAGRLSLRQTQWHLWHASEGFLPGVRPLRWGSPWGVYQAVAPYPPLAVPTTASYIKALVRSRVWPYIEHGQALHTHTDSVHLPAGVDGPDVGNAPGDWALKSEGQAEYWPDRYRIGETQTKTWGK